MELFTPRFYQVEALEWLKSGTYSSGRGIIADEQGLGKLGEACMAKKHFAPNTSDPVLLVGSISAQAQYLLFAERWGVSKPIVIDGSPSQRAAMWKRAQSLGGFYCITPQALIADCKWQKSTAKEWKITSSIAPQRWKMIIWEEAHKATNRKSKQHILGKWLAEASPHFIYVTGTPMRRGPQNLWALLNTLFPEQFTSYWRFVERYCVVVRGHFGWEIVGARNTHNLAEELSKALLRREKSYATPWLPKKIRIGNGVDELILDMTPTQAHIYQQIANEMMADLPEGNFLITPTVLAKCVRLRQCLVTPKILHPEISDYGAAIEDFIQKYEETDDTHCVVFTPFADAFPFIHERLEQIGVPASQIFLFRGGTSAGDLSRQLDSFHVQRGIAICTIAFAESFDFYPASWAYYLGFEWDPLLNGQSEDRLHRAIEGASPPTLYYPTHRGGIDREVMSAVVGEKVRAINLVWSDYRALLHSLKGKQS